MKFEDLLFGTVAIDSEEGAYLPPAPITLNQRLAPCSLYIGSEVGLEEKRVATASALLARLNDLDLRARRALAAADFESRVLIDDFIEFHVEEIPEWVIERFGELPKDHQTFLEGLDLSGVGIHAGETGLSLNLDYSIGRAHSDELLVVKFDENGQVRDIAHES